MFVVFVVMCCFFLTKRKNCFKMFFSLLTLSAGLVTGQTTYPLVPVDVYYEAQCPSCQAFITGTLSSTLALSDIYQITDLKMVYFTFLSIHPSYFLSRFPMVILKRILMVPLLVNMVKESVQVM